jgi:uncharacterized protein (TIGR02679 family)
MPPLAQRYASEPGLRRLLKSVAARYRSLGRIGGTVWLRELTPEEARVFHHLGLTGRTVPWAGGDARIDARRLDHAVSGAGGLLAVLRAAGHDLATAEQHRAEVAAHRDEAWAWAADAAKRARAAGWVAELRRTRGGHPPRALVVVLAALEALDDDATTWDRACLATEAAHDPHALDDGTAAGALLTAALAHRDGTEVPAGAADRRALLALHGIRTDPHSSTVLVLGLRTTGRGPAARQLAAADGDHLVLTFAQLAASQLSPVRGVVRTCEGPVLLRAVEERLGRPGVPLVCTEGQPSAACSELLRQLDARTEHSGDFEWGGLRIAAVMHRRHGATRWRHGVADYESALQRLPGRATRLAPPRGVAPDGLEEVWGVLDEHRIPVWQEDLLDVLLDDLA